MRFDICAWQWFRIRLTTAVGVSNVQRTVAVAAFTKIPDAALSAASAPLVDRGLS